MNLWLTPEIEKQVGMYIKKPAQFFVSGLAISSLVAETTHFYHTPNGRRRRGLAKTMCVDIFMTENSLYEKQNANVFFQ